MRKSSLESGSEILERIRRIQDPVSFTGRQQNLKTMTRSRISCPQIFLIVSTES